MFNGLHMVYVGSLKYIAKLQIYLRYVDQLAFYLHSCNVVTQFANVINSGTFLWITTPHQKPASFPVPFSWIHHQTDCIFKEEIVLQALLEAGCPPALGISRYYCWAEEAAGCWPLTTWGWHISCSNRQQMGTRCGGLFVRLSGGSAPAHGKVWARQGWALRARTADVGVSGGGRVCPLSYRYCSHRPFPTDKP